ncbi:MAG: anaerobic ribonucleoside-triphosphate reductase [Clostridia bacterium]|nr:anaerobic ribonucleoside-triphosphate reductase [Clostridia bacterium]MBR2177175.1 anaerobic ribonucleoside-triphosphate reductase [Clostridia bacterium]
MRIIKRNSSEEPFNIEKIVSAITKANKATDTGKLTEDQIRDIAEYVEYKCTKINRAVSVEEIQDMVEDQIMAKGAFQLARNYVRYRYTRSLIRSSNTTDNKILSLIECNNEEAKQENSNKNPTVNSVQRDYMAGEVSKDLTKRMLLPLDIVEAHEKGIIHFHDADYFAQHMHNCDLVNLDDMLQNGTVISETLIERPHSFSTACNIATQIIAQVASNQYGGQSISLTHLAPFVQISREKIKREFLAEIKEMGIEVSQDKIDGIVEERLRKEITKGVQTIQYQVVTLLTTNGQAPFVTVFMYLNEARNEREKKDLAMIIEETLRQRCTGVKNEAGVWITPAFPKLIYVLEEDNIHEGDPYYYLTELAARCTAKRMVPDYISEKVMLKNKIDKNGNGHCYTCMGCRSFLTPYIDENGNPKYYGRFNQGVVTVNLVDIGLSADKDMNQFWKIFDERMDLCHRALRCRHDRLKGTLSDAAPILWQYGAISRLKKGEPIDRLLYGGYSTLSLGYAGLWECVYSLIGKKLTEEEGKALGLEIMKKLNEYCAKWKAEENIDYSIYGTPLESTTYKFAKCLQKRFGIKKGITDRNYITNSYHVHVTEEINAFDKLKLESEFQTLSPGGAISYVEVPDMQNNIAAVMQVIRFIYDNIMYAELNTKSDFCQVCGYSGEIQIVKADDGKLVWECPNCKNRDQNKMNVARRTCGYIGTQFWNQGRTQEIKERVIHLSNSQFAKV